MKKISNYFLFFFLLLSSNLFSAEKQKELIKEHEPKQKCEKLECQVLKGMEGVKHEVPTHRQSKGKSHLNYERQ